MNPKGPALPFLDFFLSSVFGFCFGKILTFWGKRREREREREREERERERDDHDNDASQLHPLFSPSLAKKKFQGSSCFTLLRTKANKFNVCYSIFSPRCRCAEDFFEEIFQGLRENRRSRASCRCAYVVAISFSEK